MSMNFAMSFDPGSLEELVKIAGFAALMEVETTAMLAATGTLLVTAAQMNTWAVFDHPTGTLASSITFFVVSPTEIEVDVGVIYGHRGRGRKRERVESGREEARRPRCIVVGNCFSNLTHAITFSFVFICAHPCVPMPSAPISNFQSLLIFGLN